MSSIAARGGAATMFLKRNSSDPLSAVYSKFNKTAGGGFR
jgi:hypothetical protein